MGIDTILAAFTGALMVLGYVVYDTYLLKGASKPNQFSWFIWTCVGWLNFLVHKQLSWNFEGSILPFLGASGCAVTFALALTKGELRKPTKYDIIGLSMGLVACVALWKYRSPESADALVQAATAIGCIPTYASVIRDPKAEKPYAWGTWSIMFAIYAVVVILRWRGKYSDFVYPVNGFVVYGGVALLSCVRVRAFCTQSVRKLTCAS